MVFGSMLIVVELEVSIASFWVMVSILNLLHHFSFQFIKNDSATMWRIENGVHKNGG